MSKIFIFTTWVCLLFFGHFRATKSPIREVSHVIMSRCSDKNQEEPTRTNRTNTNNNKPNKEQEQQQETRRTEEQKQRGQGKTRARIQTKHVCSKLLPLSRARKKQWPQHVANSVQGDFEDQPRHWNLFRWVTKFLRCTCSAKTRRHG